MSALPERSSESRRAVAYLLGLGSCGLTALSLFSYSPTDPSFSSRSSVGDVANWCGRLGALTADLLLQVIGWSSWAVVPLGIWLWLRFARRPAGNLARLLIGLFGVWWAATLFSLLFFTDAAGPYPPGGLIGQLTAEVLLANVGAAGSYIVAGLALLTVATVTFGIDWEAIAGASVDAVGEGAPAAGHAIVRAGRAAATRGADAVTGTWRLLRSRPLYLRLRDEEEDEDLEEEDSFHTGLEEEPSLGDGPSAAPPSAPGLAIPIHSDPDLGLDPDVTQHTFDVSAPMEREVPTVIAARQLVEVELVPTGIVPSDGLFSSAHAPSEAGLDALSEAGDEGPAARGRGLQIRPQIAEDEPLSPLPPGIDPRDAPDAVGLARARRQLELPVDGAPPPRSAPQPAPQLAAPARAQPPAAVPPAAVPPAAVPPAAVPPAAVPPAAPSNAASASVRAAILPGYEEAFDEDPPSEPRRRRPQSRAFVKPGLDLLDEYEREITSLDEGALKELAEALEQKLSDFKIKGEVTAIQPGPVITIFEFLPAPGVKLSRIAALTDDIAMAMRAIRVRIVAPIPGRGVVGIEIPNKKRQMVWFRELMVSKTYRKGNWILPMCLGKTVEGRPYVADLAKMPHLLVGGTTGSGKSVGVNSMLMTLLYHCTPEELRMILIDPKMLEFELYSDIPHLLHPVVTEPKLAAAALKWACTEMDNRYRILARWGTRNIKSYNEKVEQELADWTPEKARRYAPKNLAPGEEAPPPRKFPYIVIVIDELADLMMVAAKDVEESIVRLAQKARACGIHLIVATQRPSVDVITGLIKANMPSRIAFQVRSKIDGRTILDQNGAETLLGKGDMLLLPPGVSALVRLHGPFVSDGEAQAVADYLRDQGEPDYSFADIRVEEEGDDSDLGEDEYDEFYDVAVQIVTESGKASTSMIQRRLKIGYNRAARIIEMMERDGVVGPADGSRPREVLAGRQ
jgi:S-DNA-T family DNA segregation ATPase FtsK/SpoIIIE